MKNGFKLICRSFPSAIPAPFTGQVLKHICGVFLISDLLIHTGTGWAYTTPIYFAAPGITDITYRAPAVCAPAVTAVFRL